MWAMLPPAHVTAKFRRCAFCVYFILFAAIILYVLIFIWSIGPQIQSQEISSDKWGRLPNIGLCDPYWHGIFANGSIEVHKWGTSDHAVSGVRENGSAVKSVNYYYKTIPCIGFLTSELKLTWPTEQFGFTEAGGKVHGFHLVVSLTPNSSITAAPLPNTKKQVWLYSLNPIDFSSANLSEYFSNPDVYDYFLGTVPAFSRRSGTEPALELEIEFEKQALISRPRPWSTKHVTRLRTYFKNTHQLFNPVVHGRPLVNHPSVWTVMLFMWCQKSTVTQIEFVPYWRRVITVVAQAGGLYQYVPLLFGLLFVFKFNKLKFGGKGDNVLERSTLEKRTLRGWQEKETVESWSDEDDTDEDGESSERLLTHGSC